MRSHLKHNLKAWLRLGYARFLFYTGLHALVSRCMPARLTILAGHCVSAPSNAFLPDDMKIDAAHLEGLLDWLGKRYEWVTVGDGWRRLRAGEGGSTVALSMDDGYRDNLELLLPLLKKRGLTATVYLESRPLCERRLNWTHLYFWILERRSPAQFVENYAAQSADSKATAALQQALRAGSRLTYQLKRVLKYEADQADCTRTLRAIFAELGGDEALFCDGLYLDWDGARALQEGGLELGAHTVNHWVLSGLPLAEQERELQMGRLAMERELGRAPISFAYPFGRRWDWNADSLLALESAGFENATSTHAGCNLAGSDPRKLARIMIDRSASLPLIVAEACGGFELLRRLGLDLSE